MIRAAFLLLISAMILIPGCKTADSGEAINPGVVHIGKDAADIDRGRARIYSREMEALAEARDRLKERRRQLASDGLTYRRKAARVREDRSLSEFKRKRYAEQYLTLAAERDNQARRLAELVRSYDEQINRLNSKRRYRLHRGDSFERIIVPEP